MTFGPRNLPPVDENMRYSRTLPKTKKFGGKEFQLHSRDKTTRSKALDIAKYLRWCGNYTRLVKESETGSFREWVVYIRRK
jgi:hypothetical protein